MWECVQGRLEGGKHSCPVSGHVNTQRSVTRLFSLSLLATAYIIATWRVHVARNHSVSENPDLSTEDCGCLFQPQMGTRDFKANGIYYMYVYVAIVCPNKVSGSMKAAPCNESDTRTTQMQCML